MGVKGVLGLIAVLGGIAAAGYYLIKKSLDSGANSEEVATPNNPGPTSNLGPGVVSSVPVVVKNVVLPVKSSLPAKKAPEKAPEPPKSHFAKVKYLGVTGRGNRASHVWDVEV